MRLGRDVGDHGAESRVPLVVLNEHHDGRNRPQEPLGEKRGKKRQDLLHGLRIVQRSRSAF